MARIRCAQIGAVLKGILVARLNDELTAAELPVVPDGSPAFSGQDNYYLGSTFVSMPLAAGVLPGICMAWNDPQGGARRRPFSMGKAWEEDVHFRIWYGLEFQQPNADTQLDKAEHGISIVGAILDEDAMTYPQPPIAGAPWWKSGYWTTLGSGHMRSVLPTSDAHFTGGYLNWRCLTFNVTERP